MRVVSETYRRFKMGRWLFGHGHRDDALDVVITGLTATNGQYNNFAEIGQQLDVTVDGGAPDTIAFGSTPGGNEYGTSLPFTVPATDDTGDPLAPATLYISGTLGAENFSASRVIRAPLPTITTEADVSTAGTGLGDTITLAAAVFAGIPAAFTRALRLYSPDEDLATGNGTVSLTHDITVNEDNELIDGEDRVTTSGGIVTSDATGQFTVTDFEEPALVSAPVVTGAKIGAAPVFDVPVFSGNPTPAITYETLVEGLPVGDETYVLVEGDNLDDVSIRATATNGIGSDAVSTSAAVQITYNAPVAAAGLADPSFVDGDGNQTFDPTGDFSVAGDADLSGVTWSLPTTVAGVTIDPNTGLISFNDTTLGVQADTPIVVRATNSGGVANSAFSFSWTAAGATIALSNFVFTPAASGTQASIDFDIDYQNGSDDLDIVAAYGGATLAVTADQLIAQSGGTDVNEFGDRVQLAGTASFSGSVTGFTGASDDSPKLAIAVVERTGSAKSAVLVEDVSGIDYSNLVLSVSNPLDDAPSVAPDVNIILDFDDDVNAAGTITLKLVGGAAVEVFDLSAGTGDNGGTVTLSANAATTDRVTLNPGADLAAGTAYAINTSGLTDEAGNALPNIADDTTLNFTTAASGPTAQRDADTNKVVWFSAADIATTGTDVTSINDKVGSNDMNVLATGLSNPQFDSVSGGVDADGSVEGLHSAVVGTSYLYDEVVTNAGTITEFHVFDGSLQNEGGGVLWGMCFNDGSNHSHGIGLDNNQPDERLEDYARQFANAYGTDTDLTGGGAFTGPGIVRIVRTATTVQYYWNGVYVTGQDKAVTSANISNDPNQRFVFGGRIDAATGAISAQSAGRWFETYITTETDGPTIAALEAEIAAEWGISI